MIKFALYLSFLITICIGGCVQDQNAIRNVKFTDISPMFKDEQYNKKELMGEVAVYTLEVEADRYHSFAEIWSSLYQKSIDFEDRQAFKDNGFVAGFGDAAKWREIQEMLLQVGARKSQTVYLMVKEEMPDEMTTARVNQPLDLFYNSGGGEFSGVTFKRGSVGFQVGIEKMPAARGVVEIAVEPFYKADYSLRDNWQAFRSLNLYFEAGAGEFVMIGPDAYDAGRASLTGLFFSKPGRFPAVKVYVIACRKIFD